MRSSYLLVRLSKARRTVKLDNIALVPASLLPFKDDWQSLANQLPDGSVLLSFPADERLRAVMRRIGAQFTARGRQVKVLSSGWPSAGHEVDW